MLAGGVGVTQEARASPPREGETSHAGQEIINCERDKQGHVVLSGKLHPSPVRDNLRQQIFPAVPFGEPASLFHSEGQTHGLSPLPSRRAAGDRSRGDAPHTPLRPHGPLATAQGVCRQPRSIPRSLAPCCRQVAEPWFGCRGQGSTGHTGGGGCSAPASISSGGWVCSQSI